MRTPHLAAMALLLALAATSCGDDEPSAEPTPKMPSPTSSSTTSTPTAEPEPWEVQSRAGIKAYLQRYVEIFSEAFATGETDAFRALGTRCEGCEDFADQIQAVYDAGGSITTKGGIQFAGWSVDETGFEDGCGCIVVTKSSGSTWVRSAGADPETYPGGRAEYLVSLEWTGESWTIVGLTGLQT